ncbi:MAG TPA: hypothetical protein VN728_11555 [Stellaceae bacterium]|jgi:hypothetical protein|nr:hypothetical protein [Stellaceae bacterium]
MFKMMVAPWRDASPYLGVGTYYRARDAAPDAEPEDLVDVTLESPLILNERQVRMLVQKYGTNSADRMTALSGAWTLRREIVQMGHDGIIAVGSKPQRKPLTLVALAQPGEVVRPMAPDNSGRKSSGAQITRLALAELGGPI